MRQFPPACQGIPKGVRELQTLLGREEPPQTDLPSMARENEPAVVAKGRFEGHPYPIGRKTPLAKPPVRKPPGHDQFIATQGHGLDEASRTVVEAERQVEKRDVEPEEPEHGPRSD